MNKKVPQHQEAATPQLGKKHLPAQMTREATIGRTYAQCNASHTKETLRHTNLHELKK